MQNFTITLATLVTLTLTLSLANAATPDKAADTKVCMAPSDDVERGICETAKYIEAENRAGRTWTVSKDGIRVYGVTRADCVRFVKASSPVFVNGTKVPNSGTAVVAAACAKSVNVIYYPN